MTRRRTIVVGGGVVGLSIAFRLAQQDHPVTVIERAWCGHGTSWLAAGMLAPNAELAHEEIELHELGKESLRRWPEFAKEVEDASGEDVDYRSDGTLIVAHDSDSKTALRRNYEFQEKHGADVHWIDGETARDLEPMLSPRVTAAVYARSDHQVDNRRLVNALRVAIQRSGGEIAEGLEVESVLPHDEAPEVTTNAGDTIRAHRVVIAAGVASTNVKGLENDEIPIRPVKGQMIELRMHNDFDLSHVIRGPVSYLTPKSDGRLLVGATNEERGFDYTVTAGAIHRLLEGAWEVVPGVADLEISDMWAGLRPASRDHAPIMGLSKKPGIIYATGHYRHGILLAPVTADEIAHLVITGETSSVIAPFRPSRFMLESLFGDD